MCIFTLAHVFTVRVGIVLVTVREGKMLVTVRVSIRWKKKHIIWRISSSSSILAAALLSNFK